MQRLASILASRCPSSIKPATRSNGLQCSEMAAESGIAELADKATQELRLAWLKFVSQGTTSRPQSRSDDPGLGQ